MIKKIKQGMFPFLIAFSALSVSASAAFYSVSGLSKLFAGASLEVIIMAGSLEFAKLVTASLLYQYWDTINKTLRTYLSIATVVLVLITSMGIYGFLSAAYQETYSKLSAVENQKGFIQQKIDFYQNDVTRYDTEIERISSNISTLSNAKASTIQVRDTSVSGGFRQTISTTELRMAQNRINIEEENRKLAQSKRTIASDSLQKFQLQVLELNNNTEVAGELGPLQYLSSLTGYSMDKIINVLLLIIIFVFDPLAISLVIASNFAFEKAYPKKKYKENLYEEIVEEKSELYKTMDNIISPEVKKKYEDIPIKVAGEEEFDWEVAEKRMEIIGQNGNDGEHYSKYDLNKDGIIDANEKNRIIKQIKNIKNKVGGNLQSHPEKLKEVQRLEKVLSSKFLDEDLTKTY
jgi:hypothetical protein